MVESQIARKNKRRGGHHKVNIRHIGLLFDPANSIWHISSSSAIQLIQDIDFLLIFISIYIHVSKQWIMSSLGDHEVKNCSKMLTNGVSIDTFLASYDPCPNDPYGSSCMPLYQTATFRQPGASDFGEYDYTRSGNPTRTALEQEVALLENGPEGCRSFAFSTGMSAISAIVRLVKHGEEIIVGDDSYGGTYRLLSQVITAQYGIKVTFLNLSGAQGIINLKNALLNSDRKVRLVMIESPTNPLQRICDIKGLAEVCHNESLNTHT